MTLTFYYAPMSTASVTEAVLAELGIACDRIKLDIDAGDTRKPQFLAVNPNGRVPTIVHDGTPIWESSAITMYLGEIFGVELGLYPAPGPQRGAAMKWIAWASATLGEAAGRLSAAQPVGSPGAVQAGSVDYVPSAHQVAGTRERAQADVAACLRILDNALKGQPFLNGDYSLADTHLFVLVGWIGSMDVDIGTFKYVSAWLNRCGARPALSSLMAG
ncbi:MAG: glutathione S-transferase family protein [Rhodospirillaceae bacterium]|nr:glutathione S-transferase family protein [Rhodospirillaceae bacterium]